MCYRYCKLLIDFSLAGIALVLTLPLMLGIALLIALTMGRPIFFVQPRVGKQGRIFNIYKFRSMTSETRPDGCLLPNHQRLTSVGKWLRKTSLDELPQLWNVIKQDMSLIGPRPLLPDYLPYYTAEENKRHQVLPGITGWAQVNGRHYSPWDQRLALDVWYSQQHSLWLDTKILGLTIIQVLSQRYTIALQEQVLEDFTCLRRRQIKMAASRHTVPKAVGFAGRRTGRS